MARLACWAVVVKTHGPAGLFGYPQPFGSYRSLESTPFVLYRVFVVVEIGDLLFWQVL